MMGQTRQPPLAVDRGGDGADDVALAELPGEAADSDSELPPGIAT